MPANMSPELAAFVIGYIHHSIKNKASGACGAELAAALKDSPRHGTFSFVDLKHPVCYPSQPPTALLDSSSHIHLISTRLCLMLLGGRKDPCANGVLHRELPNPLDD